MNKKNKFTIQKRTLEELTTKNANMQKQNLHSLPLVNTYSLPVLENNRYGIDYTFTNPILDKTIGSAIKGFEYMNEFYETKSESKIKESLKHLVPMYTAHRASEIDFPIAVFVGTLVDIGKIIGYGYLAVKATEYIQNIL